MFDDTIAAIATPLGEGGLAVVRLSGPAALQVADKGFRGAVIPSKAESHTLHYGEIHRRDQNRVRASHWEGKESRGGPARPYGHGC